MQPFLLCALIKNNMWDKNKIPLRHQWIAINCSYWTLKHAVTAHWGIQRQSVIKKCKFHGYHRNHSDPEHSSTSCAVLLNQSPLHLSIHISRYRIGFTTPCGVQITGPENKASCLFPGSAVLVESSPQSWVSLATGSGCKTVGRKQFPTNPWGNYFQAWKPEICLHSVPLSI